MSITFTAPALTKGKRDQLERTRRWLEDMAKNLAAKTSEVDDLRERLAKAEANREKFNGKAAFQEEAAMKLAGAERQITLLTPIVRQKEKALASSVAVVGNQIGNVRKDDIKETLRVDLYDQLLALVTERMKPLYAAKHLPGVARNLAAETDLFHIINGYLGRIAPRPSNAESARAWVSLTIAEIDEILAGGTLVSFDPESGQTVFVDMVVAERLKIDLDQLVSDSQS